MVSSSSLSRRWLILALGLIVLSTILFVAGVVIERGTEASVPRNTHQDASSLPTASSDPDGGHDETPPPGSKQGSSKTETVFGLDLENPFLVGSFVLVWLGLAVALLRLGRLVWVVLLLVAIGASALDMAEFWRQWTSVHFPVATFALLVTLAHMALVVLAV
jgi:hypothetical protein